MSLSKNLPVCHRHFSRSHKKHDSFSDVYSNLVTLQKGYVSYNDVVYEMRVQATTNRKRIGKKLNSDWINLRFRFDAEDILNRPDLKKIN